MFFPTDRAAFRRYEEEALAARKKRLATIESMKLREETPFDVDYTSKEDDHHAALDELWRALVADRPASSTRAPWLFETTDQRFPTHEDTMQRPVEALCIPLQRSGNEELDGSEAQDDEDPLEEIELRWASPMDGAKPCTPSRDGDILAYAVANGLGDIDFAWHEDACCWSALVDTSQHVVCTTPSTSELDAFPQSNDDDDVIEICSLDEPLALASDNAILCEEAYPLEIIRNIYTSRMSNSKLSIPCLLDMVPQSLNAMVDALHTVPVERRPNPAVDGLDVAPGGPDGASEDDDALRFQSADDPLAMYSIIGSAPAASRADAHYRKAILDCDQFHVSAHPPSLFDAWPAHLKNHWCDIAPEASATKSDTVVVQQLEVPRLKATLMVPSEALQARAMLHQAMTPTDVIICPTIVAMELPMVWSKDAHEFTEELDAPTISATDEHIASTLKRSQTDDRGDYSRAAKRPKSSKAIAYKLQDEHETTIGLVNLGDDEQGVSDDSSPSSSEELLTSLQTFVLHAARPVIWKLVKCGQFRYQETKTKSALEHLALSTLEAMELAKVDVLGARRSPDIMERCHNLGELIYLHTLRLLWHVLQEHGVSGGVMLLEACLSSEVYQKTLRKSHMSTLHSMLQLVAPSPEISNDFTPEKNERERCGSPVREQPIVLLCAEDFPYREHVSAQGRQLVPRPLDSPLGLVLDTSTGLCVAPLAIFLDDGLAQMYAYKLAEHQTVFTKIWVVLGTHFSLLACCTLNDFCSLTELHSLSDCSTSEKQVVEAHVQAFTASTSQFTANVITLMSHCPEDTLHFVSTAIAASDRQPVRSSGKGTSRALSGSSFRPRPSTHLAPTTSCSIDRWRRSWIPRARRLCPTPWRPSGRGCTSRILHQDHGLAMSHDDASSSDE
ncbi:hypothetical protein, variant [Saprolegnia diclina VS20]|uniref:Uncharacterized protein n=1 Tax=Saprolegnia diclina (strain VS20) TaxID=1156394 RepID=T0PX74_SAPDV|nr:hypothetical protein, variant [Saprolegnia diclina VS20]EQC26856.1 hypothetical protein, variant [Saprolegnia diclina VS20]|eukprot:XP_008619758.1 hypothetical protein, variant [Saprolegnia diclina VS20]